MTGLFAHVEGSTDDVPVRSETDLQSLVARLDGDKVSMIVLYRDDGQGSCNFTLAGGPRRLVACWDRQGDPPYLTLLTKSPPAERVNLVAGGQLADYDPQVAVTPDEALAAAAEFMKTGKPSPNLDWREE